MTVEMCVCELCGCYPSSKEQGAVLPHSIALGAAVVGLAVPRQGPGLACPSSRLPVSSSWYGQGTGVVPEPALRLQGGCKCGTEMAGAGYLSASLPVLS